MPARAAALLLTLAAAPSVAHAQSPTHFARDPALFHAKQAVVVAALRQQSPSAAGEIEKLFREQDVLAILKPEFARLGLDPDDAADMTAAYWVAAWEASQGLAGQPTDPALSRGARDQMRRTLAANRAMAGLDDAGKQDIADTMLLQALLADLRMRAALAAGPAARRQMSDAIRTEAQSLLKVDLRAIRLTKTGFSGAAAAPAPAPAPPAARPAAPAKPGDAGEVAGLYFRSIAAHAGVDFEPLVLFASGDYWEMGETPIADLNLADSKAREPRRWGRWRQQGASFLLTGADGKTNDYQLGSGNFFPAFPAEQGPALSGRYSRTTSAGTLAAGGTSAVLMIGVVTFRPDGSFTEGERMGAQGNGVYAGRNTARAGRYKVSGTTLELTYADGAVKRTSFAYGASGRPPRASRDMIFIGGDIFVSD